MVACYFHKPLELCFVYLNVCVGLCMYLRMHEDSSFRCMGPGQDVVRLGGRSLCTLSHFNSLPRNMMAGSTYAHWYSGGINV